MSHNITVEGGTSVRLPTGGKYCDRDIIITAEGGAEDLDAVLTEQEGLIDELKEVLKGKAAGGSGGYEEGYKNGMDAVIMQTAVSYSNDTITSMAQGFFAGNPNLVSISLPKITHLNGFANCTALKNCDFSGVRYVQSGALKGCTALEEIRFPSAEQIHANVFENCTSLKTLILSRTNNVVQLTNVNSFTNTPIASGNGYIYVPAALVDRYKVAENWQVYAAQFRAIEDYPEITGGDIW